MENCENESERENIYQSENKNKKKGKSLSR